MVGGGISGLVCAYALRKAGVQTQVIEAEERPGGVIRTERREGFLLELGPQSFSGTAALRALCRELGIEDQLVEAPPRAPRYVLVDGTLRAVPLSPPALLASSLLSARTKWSIARDALGRSRPPAADESIADFVRRKFTPELLDRLVGPFVSGIYAGDAERLSVRAAFPQLYEAEKSAGSILRGMLRAARARTGPRERPSLLTFREGNEALALALAAKLGAGFCARAEARSVAVKQGGAAQIFEVIVERAGVKEAVLAETLILATPTDVAGRLLREVSPSFEEQLGSVEYAPVAIVSLGYERECVGHSLDGFGFLVPRSAGRRVLGTVWNSSLFAGRAPEGCVLLTSFVGGMTDRRAADLSAADLTELVHREIAPLMAIGEKPIFSNVQTHRRALPQYNLGHGERLSAIEELRRDWSNLRFTGNYLRGPAIGACIEQALEISAAVKE